MFRIDRALLESNTKSEQDYYSNVLDFQLTYLIIVILSFIHLLLFTHSFEIAESIIKSVLNIS